MDRPEVWSAIRNQKRPRVGASSGVRLRQAVPFLVIALISCLLYANTVPNPLVYDDLELIPKSTAIRDPWNIQAIFGGSYWGEVRSGAIYRPLTVWSLALNYRTNELLGEPGEQPLGFHLANVLLHTVVGCLLYRYLTQLQLPVWSNLATTLLFAAHPIHTEAVAGVVGRAEVLAVLFGLLFLLLHRQRRAMAAGAVAYLLAMWSKESAVAFFPVAVTMDALFRVPSRRWPLGAYGVYALTVIVWFALRSQALGDMPRPVPFIDNPLVAVTFPSRLFTAARVQLDYLRLQLIPVGLSSDYSYNQIPILVSAANLRVLGCLVIALAVAGLAWVWRRRHPVVLFAVVGYAVLFSTTSNLVLPIGTIMGERLAYAPSVFFCLLLGYGAWRLRQAVGHPAVAAAPAALCVAYAVLTVDRNQMWADEVTFFRAQVRAAPRSAKAHYNLGAAFAKTGDDRAAIQEYETAISIFSYYPEPFYNMGNALRRLKANPEKMIEAYRNAIRFDPGHANARVNLALVLLDLNRIDEARSLVNELAQVDPQHPSLAMLRLRVGANKGMSTTALPDDLQQGIALYVNGDYTGALQRLERALGAGTIPLQMRKTALMMLARACEATGNTERATTYRQQAATLDPASIR
ncbi:MAG: tetratricopeptide repeat protein [Candidatus Latescibacteria bacterium]|nr:tetratricopeptide repeat protein [Candidatus Latescibacterota bacterium]